MQQQLATKYPWLVMLLQIWSIPWKGLALWIAAKKNDKWWFIALLILQTIGIVDIIYIFFVAKHKFELFRKKNKK